MIPESSIAFCDCGKPLEDWEIPGPCIGCERQAIEDELNYQEIE